MIIRKHRADIVFSVLIGLTYLAHQTHGKLGNELKNSFAPKIFKWKDEETKQKKLSVKWIEMNE